MSFYELEPRDPIVLGDGRSVGQNTMTQSLEVPFPSTVAGLARSRRGTKADGSFNSAGLLALLQESLRGPVLERLDPNPTLFLPAPADVLFLEGDGSDLVRRRLTPLTLGPDDLTDLPEGLHPIGLVDPDPRKPSIGPRYWAWKHAQQWLTQPANESLKPNDLGLDGLEREERVHVALTPARTALEGALFRTEGVRYQRRMDSQVERFALRFGWDGQAITPGVVSLGGERRLSSLRRSEGRFPGIPSDLVSKLTTTRRARIWLLTPALFDGGFRPGTFGVGVTLTACAVGRAAVVSGWDHDTNSPKATRRCAPAGSIYWVELAPEVNVSDWVGRHWFQNISSADQDRRDGFGLAVVGVA